MLTTTLHISLNPIGKTYVSYQEMKQDMHFRYPQSNQGRSDFQSGFCKQFNRRFANGPHEFRYVNLIGTSRNSLISEPNWGGPTYPIKKPNKQTHTFQYPQLNQRRSDFQSGFCRHFNHRFANGPHEFRCVNLIGSSWNSLIREPDWGGPTYPIKNLNKQTRTSDTHI